MLIAVAHILGLISCWTVASNGSLLPSPSPVLREVTEAFTSQSKQLTVQDSVDIGEYR